MKYYFFCIAACAGVLSSPFFVFSQTSGALSVSADSPEVSALNQQIAERRDRVEQLEASIEEYKKKIQQKQLEKVSLSNQVAILDARTEQVSADIEVTRTKLDTVSLEIESMELSIADTQRTIDRQKQMVAEFLRAIHRQGGENFVEVLAAYNTFSDFYNHLQYLERVDRDIGKSVKELRGAKDRLVEKNNQAKERKAAYEALGVELTNKKKDLEANVFAKQDLLAKTHASEATYQTLLSNLKKQYQDTEDEISSIESQVRKRLEQENKITISPSEPGGNVSWPTQSRYITAYFHDPEYPFRNVFEHSAIDIRASHGTAVHAAASGYVAQARRCTTASCYSYVMIVHTGSLSTLYGHLSQIIVQTDQFVTRGDIIGYSGGTPGTVGAGPFVTGPHLHMEVRLSGIPVDPLLYLVRDY